MQVWVGHPGRVKPGDELGQSRCQAATFISRSRVDVGRGARRVESSPPVPRDQETAGGHRPTKRAQASGSTVAMPRSASSQARSNSSFAFGPRKKSRHHARGPFSRQCFQ